MSDFASMFNLTCSEMQWEALGDMPLSISSPIPNSRQLCSAKASFTPYHPIEPSVSSTDWASHTNEPDAGSSFNLILSYSRPDFQCYIEVDRASGRVG